MRLNKLIAKHQNCTRKEADNLIKNGLVTVNGLLTLLPIIFNIFFMHVFFDNRVDENIETGFLLVINIILLLKYKKQFFSLFLKKESH